MRLGFALWLKKVSMPFSSEVLHGAYYIPVSEGGKEVFLFPLHTEDAGKIERWKTQTRVLLPGKMFGVVSGGMEKYQGRLETLEETLQRESDEELHMFIALWQITHALPDIKVQQVRNGQRKNILGHGAQVTLTERQVRRAKQKYGIDPLRVPIQDLSLFINRHTALIRPSTSAALMLYLSQQGKQYAI